MAIGATEHLHLWLLRAAVALIRWASAVLAPFDELVLKMLRGGGFLS